MSSTEETTAAPVLAPAAAEYLSGFTAGVNHGYHTGRTDVARDRSQAVEDAYRRGATAAHTFDKPAKGSDTVVLAVLGAVLVGIILGRAAERRIAERALEQEEPPYDVP